MVQRGYGSSISVLSEGNEGRVQGQVCKSTVVLLLKDGAPIPASGGKLANSLLAAEVSAVRSNRRKSRFFPPSKRLTVWRSEMRWALRQQAAKGIAMTRPSWWMLAMSGLVVHWQESGENLLLFCYRICWSVFSSIQAGELTPWNYFTEN
jgi:hypothetical protein